MTSSTLIQMRARFNSQCPGCTKRIRYDDPMTFDSIARIAYHPGCVPVAAQQAASAAAPVAKTARMMRCRRCGTSGAMGQYPFSTLATMYVCDDCGE